MRCPSRRIFLQRSLLALAALPLLRVVCAWPAEQKPVAPPAGQKPVAATDPVASAIGYRANVKDIDYKQYPQRAKPEAKNQFCAGCANYAYANEGWGKCQIINGLVSAHGWCGAWAKRG